MYIYIYVFMSLHDKKSLYNKLQWFLSDFIITDLLGRSTKEADINIIK